MKQRVILFICLGCFFFAGPLWAGEELMTRLFFAQWLDNTLHPLEVNIKELNRVYADLTQQVQEITARLQTEIKVIIAEKRAFIDGEPVELDVAPFIREGRTMVPVRFIGEALGADFLWEEKEKKVSYIYRDILLEIFIDQKNAFLNKEPFLLDCAPCLVAGRTLVPLRLVSEQIGALVDWDEATQMVTITR